jgi:hypothetical protein
LFHIQKAFSAYKDTIFYFIPQRNCERFGWLNFLPYLCSIIIKKTFRDMTTIIAIAAFVAVALVGWFIAEGKGKFVTYSNNEQEDAVLAQNRCQLEEKGYTELNISDVIRTIATTGYSAV